MPAESKNKQLVLAILKQQRRAFTPRQIAQKLGKSDKNSLNLIRHYLLDFWRKGPCIRSEREIALEYHYFFGKKERDFLFEDQKIRFVRYNQELNSGDLKKKITELLRAQGPLTVKEISALVKPDFNLTFLKKINFHLQDLYLKKQIVRSSKPYQYYISKKDTPKISEEKASLPTLLLHSITKHKKALFTSELIQELGRKGIKGKLSTISLALQRLCRQQKIVSSKTRFGTRSAKTGYLWALTPKQVQARFRQELPLEVQKLLHQNEISLREFCTALKISPANARRWMSKISAELPGLVVDEQKQKLIVSTNAT